MTNPEYTPEMADKSGVGMFHRLIKLFHKHSFFLFGARGTGKSTLLGERFPSSHCLWLNLLDSRLVEEFTQDPSRLYAIVKGQGPEITHIIIDEIQKVPKLLDEVHRLMEEKLNKIFILTGSSARKLKRGGANLLAGRAFVSHLFPLSCFELKDAFNLDDALQWGTLPEILQLSSQEEREAYLRAYASTYLKEEILDEQLVRKLPPFRRFLEVAAQCNGKIINYANIAHDVGVDEKTIKEYFIILEDTLIGFFLEPYHTSFRKRLVEKPKFYFFDTGVTRSLAKRLSVPLLPQTFAYGEAFEHYIILEIFRLSSYLKPDYRFSFIRTINDVEVDLVVERPEKPLLCIEIKSSKTVDEKDVSSFIKLTRDLPGCEAMVISQDRFMRRFEHVTAYPWKEALLSIFPVAVLEASS